MDNFGQISTDDYTTVSDSLTPVACKLKSALDDYHLAIDDIVHLGFNPESDTSTVKKSLESLNSKITTINEVISDVCAMLYVSISRIDSDVFQEEDKIASKVESGDF